MLGSTRIKFGPLPPKNLPPVPETGRTLDSASRTDLVPETESDGILRVSVKNPIEQTPVNGDVTPTTKREELTHVLEVWVGDRTAPANELRSAASVEIKCFAEEYIFVGNNAQPPQLDLTPYLIKSLPQEVISMLAPVSIELGAMDSTKPDRRVEIGTLKRRLEVHLLAWVESGLPELQDRQRDFGQRKRDAEVTGRDVSRGLDVAEDHSSESGRSASSTRV